MPNPFRNDTANSLITSRSSSDPVISSFLKRREQSQIARKSGFSLPPLTQPDTQIELVQPEPNVTEKIFGQIKSINPGKLFQSIIGGAKQVPAQIETAAGAIWESLNRQQEFVNRYFSAGSILRGITGQENILSRNQDEAVRRNLAFAEKTRESGYTRTQKKREEFAKEFEPSPGLQGLLEQAAFNLPQMATTTALTVATGLVTKNPIAATAVGLSTSYGLGAGEAYNTARDEGLSDAEAIPVAQVAGAIIGAIDFLPLGRLVRKSGATETIEKSLTQKITKAIVSMSVQSGFEGVTEGLQEVIGNIARATYSENKNILENVPEAAFIGAILGGFTDVTMEAAISALPGSPSQEEVIKNVQDKLEEAVNTSPEQRTEEQKQIVEALFTQELTPDEAAGYVIKNELGETDEGKQVMQAVIQAKQSGQNIKMSISEDQQTLDIELVAPDSTFQRQQSPEEEAALGEQPPLPGEESRPLETTATAVEPTRVEEYRQEADALLNQESMTPQELQRFSNIGELIGTQETIDRINEQINKAREEGNTQYVEETQPYLERKMKQMEELRQELGEKKQIEPVDEILQSRKVAQDTLKKTYNENRDAVENAFTEVMTEMEVAEAGKRIFVDNPESSSPIVVGVASTFPDWVPDALRSRELFDKVAGHIAEMIDNPTFPEGNRTRLRELVNVVLDEVDSRAGIDTANTRTAIMESYGKEAIAKRETSKNKKNTKTVRSSDAGREGASRKTSQKEKVVVKTKEEPKGLGKQKKSRLFERVKETLGAEFESQSRNYDELSLEKQSQAVADLIDSDPERASLIARGLEEPPQGMTQNAVAVGVASLAEANGDYQTAADVWSQTSLRSTRLGQEIVSLRGDMDTNNPLNAVKQVMHYRMEALTKRYEGVLKGLNVPEDANIVKKVDAIVSKEVETAKKQVTEQQKRVQSAQEIINSLIC